MPEPTPAPGPIEPKMPESQRVAQEQLAQLSAWAKTSAGVVSGALALAVITIAVAFATRPPSRVPFPIRTFGPISAGNVSAPTPFDPTVQNCPMERATTTDDFAHGASQWSKLPSDIRIGPAALTMQPPKGHFANVFHNGLFHGDATVCTKAGAYGPNMPPTLATTSGGIIFWDYIPAKAGPDDFYVFQVNYLGNFTAFHRSKNKWTLLRGPTHSNVIRTHPGIYNILAVRTSGNVAFLYVNGTQVDAVSGNPPGVGWWAGIIGGNGADEKPDTGWSFGAYAQR